MLKIKSLIIVILLIGTLYPIIGSANTILSINGKLEQTDNYDLVIISPEAYYNDLLPLITHKNNLKVKTIFQSTEDIYLNYPGRDHPEKIKYFIKYALETWNITYILLVGGSTQIPCRYTNIYFEYDYQNNWQFSSDLYYADIYFENGSFSSWDTNNNNLFAEYNWSGQYDTIDYNPDVYIGRLPCTNTQEINNVVNKIINYETSNAWTQPWFKNLIVIGGDSLPGDEHQIDEGEYVNQHVINILTGFNPDKVWASLGRLAYAININIAINPGAGFVFFNGHGHITQWATHPHESYTWVPPGSYRNNHINTLTNGHKLPIIISDACYHCAFDTTSDVFGWAFVKKASGGAIGFLGGTDIDVSYSGEAIITKGIERLCLLISTNFMNGDATFGELWGHGIQSYISDTMDEIDIITVSEFQAFGDPSLRIANTSKAPNKPNTPIGPTMGQKGQQYTYETTTIDPDNDTVYYKFDWDDGSNSQWLGPYQSGEIISANHTWNYKGTYNIRVKAKDHNGMMSEWSDPLIIKMPYNHNFRLHKILEFFWQIFYSILF
jgi:hypothetical protein